ncbi:MAG: transcription elongation factor GreA [Deltaproteobacteria bacterium]|nr:transcription elongation factor GreA [Deltaproteobacteria bacterium]
MHNVSIKLTQEGLEKLKEELKGLEEVKRPRAVDRLAQARSMGDLAENNDYIQAKEELGMMDGRINELNEIIARADVVTNGVSTNGAVCIGSTVTVSVDGRKQQFCIVGEWEADPVNRKISHQSPLGQALIGKIVGEVVEFDAPVGKVKYKIVGVS